MINQATVNTTLSRPEKRWSPRKRALTAVIIAVILLAAMIVGGWFIGPENLEINFSIKNSPPSWAHPFGTDWLGRDMLLRTIEGLTLSFGIGLLAASISVVIATILSLLAVSSTLMDSIVTWLIDLFLGLPHLVTLILISFALGGGFQGVVVGIALTHWPRLTRLLRAEVYQIKNTNYVAASQKLGKSRRWIAVHHVVPHLVPQLIVGFILLFPHAILHEAAISFLGFGLSAEQPAIGIILSESMRYLATGTWWLALFPGLMLLAMVGLFDIMGRNLRKLVDPFHGKQL